MSPRATVCAAAPVSFGSTFSFPTKKRWRANLLAGIDSSDADETDVSYVYTGDLKRIWRLEERPYFLSGKKESRQRKTVKRSISPRATVCAAAPVSFGSTFSFPTKKRWRDAGFNVLNEAAVGQPMKTYVYGLAEVAGNDLAANADYRYLTDDHLGSTRGMWDGGAGTLGNWDFTPYGGEFIFAGPTDVTQLYTGHYLDRVSKQYYAPFRFVNPGVNRWSSLDPLGMVGGTNQYAYAINDPVNHVDLLGLLPLSEFPEFYACYITGLFRDRASTYATSAGPFTSAIKGARERYWKRTGKGLLGRVTPFGKRWAKSIPFIGFGITIGHAGSTAYGCRQEAIERLRRDDLDRLRRLYQGPIEGPVGFPGVPPPPLFPSDVDCPVS